MTFSGLCKQSVTHHLYLYTYMMDMAVNPKIMGKPPQIIHFKRVFHEINHPFWGCSPYFWVDPHIVIVMYTKIMYPLLSCIGTNFATSLAQKKGLNLCPRYPMSPHDHLQNTTRQKHSMLKPAELVVQWHLHNLHLQSLEKMQRVRPREKFNCRDTSV